MFTVYKILKKAEVGSYHTKFATASVKVAMDDMFSALSQAIKEVEVYETLDEIPEEFLGKINWEQASTPVRKVPEKVAGFVYGVIRNTDMAQGSGKNYVWVLLADPVLASKIAAHNGLSGSNALIAAIPLNTD